VIVWPDLRRVARESRDVVEHRAVARVNGRGAVVFFEGADEILIQSYSTQKLCVRFDSIMTAVQNGDDRGDHFVLTAG
jgi:hypothetical protein